MSIRTKLTLWYSAVLLAGFVLFGAALSALLQRHLMSSLDQRLRERAAGAQAVVAEESHRGPDALREELNEYAEAVAEGTFIFVWDSGGRMLLSADGAKATRAAACPSAPDSFRDGVSGGRQVRALSTTAHIAGSPWRLCVVTSLDSINDTLRVLRLLLITLTPAVIVLAAAGGFWISSRALRPVDQMTTAARSIGVNNLSERLPIPAAPDELQRLAGTWNEMLERLRLSFERIERFTADASHELRTPLALIRATAELAMRRDRAAEEYRSALSSIQVEAQRLTELTENLLALARSDAPGLNLRAEPVDLSRLAREVASEVAPLAGEKAVRIAPPHEAERVTAAGDEIALRRLILILVENALEYTPSGGFVSIATAQNNGTAELKVSDSGGGIAPEDLPHIFERFYRGDPARRRGGAGLGLSIAQAIVSAHGGSIRAESAAGAGSRFTVSLPVRPPASPS